LRIDLLADNAEIFKSQGLAMNNYANRNCRAVVITNPVNTMMYILQKYATDFPKENFSSLSRLD